MDSFSFGEKWSRMRQVFEREISGLTRFEESFEGADLIFFLSSIRSFGEVEHYRIILVEN